MSNKRTTGCIEAIFLSPQEAQARGIQASYAVSVITENSPEQKVVSVNGKVGEVVLTTNDLENDSGFITNAVNDLVHYYTKNQTYTQTQVNSLIEAISKVTIQIVDELPETGATNVIYFVPKAGKEGNYYDEYAWINNAWEHIGNTEVDLSDYYKKEEADALLAEKQDKLTAGAGIVINSNKTITYDPDVLSTVDYVDGSITNTLDYVVQQDENEHNGRVAGDNLINAKIGDLSTLTTTAKTDLVGAINEVAAAAIRTGVIAPTETTAGALGEMYTCVAQGNVAVYVCTDINNTDPTAVKYVWRQLQFVPQADIDPEANSMIVPEGIDIADGEVDFTEVKASVDGNTLQI